MRRAYWLIVSIILPTSLLGALWLPLPSWGLTLEEAKTQGVVGEQADGYLGVVQPGAPAEVQALVNKILRAVTPPNSKPWKCSPAKRPSIIPSPETSFGVHRDSGSRNESGNSCGRGPIGKCWVYLPRAHHAALGVRSQPVV
jgi:hypothetical protein